MKTKGWGPFRFDWYSFCSSHQEYKENCKCCNAGHWTNHWKHLISSFICKKNYKLWYWWVNRS